MYPYACDYDKWGFSDKNGNIKVPCKYEATYIVQGTCNYPKTIREDAYFVRKKGKLYILDKGKEIRFQEVDTMPVIYAIYNHCIVFKHHRNDEYQVYLRHQKKLLKQVFILPPNIDTLNNQVYGAFAKDSSVVIDFKGKKKLIVKAERITKFGKGYIVYENYKTVRLFHQNGKIYNQNIYSDIEINTVEKSFIFVLENGKDVNLLYANGELFNPKVKIENNQGVYFANQNGISLITIYHQRDSITVYNHKGQKIINEAVKQIYYGENFYLVSNSKSYKIGPGNVILDSINYTIDERKGNTFIKYFGNKIGTFYEIIDSSYVFDKNLKFFKKFDGYVFNVFFDSLYYINNTEYKYLYDYKHDTLILCKNAVIDLNIKRARDIYSPIIKDDVYLNQISINNKQYTFENGELIQVENPIQISYIGESTKGNVGMTCEIDTQKVKYNVATNQSDWKILYKLQQELEALEKARFDYNRRLFGYLNVNRDTIMPFIYDYGVPHQNFITFEKDSIWTVFDTLTYEKIIYDRRDIISGLNYEILPNLFFTVADTSKYIAYFVYHLEHGLLLDGRSVYDFSENWDDFMYLQFEEKGQEKLIHAPSGVLIDDYEAYQSYDRYSYEYDLEIYYKENQVFLSNNKTHKIDFYKLTFEPQTNDGSRRINYDLTVFKLNENLLFMNPETMKFLASDELMEKLRITKYKSIYPK